MSGWFFEGIDMDARPTLAKQIKRIRQDTQLAKKKKNISHDDQLQGRISHRRRGPSKLLPPLSGLVSLSPLGLHRGPLFAKAERSEAIGSIKVDHQVRTCLKFPSHAQDATG